MASASEEIRKLREDIGKIPVEVTRELRPAIRRVGEPVLAQARQNASWSRRIPGALRLAVSFSLRRPGVTLVASARQAPHFRPWENLGEPGEIRHMVFGHRDRWVAQQARPSFFRALGAAEAPLIQEMGGVVEEAARKYGFR